MDLGARKASSNAIGMRMPINDCEVLVPGVVSRHLQRGQQQGAHG